MPRLIAVASLLLLWALPASAQTYVPGQVYYLPDGCTGCSPTTGCVGSATCLVAYHAGNVPVIETTPHGGYLQPASVPVRTMASCNDFTSSFVLDQDVNSQELGNNIWYRFTDAAPGKYAHLIHNLLHRNRLDANRPKASGACGNATANQAWDLFAQMVEYAKNTISGPGLLIDVHTQNLAVKRANLAYQTTATQLGNADGLLDGRGANSSLKAFAALRPDIPFSEMVRYLGTRLTSGGFPTVPSTQDWTVEGGDFLYTNSYNHQRFGCMTAGEICAVTAEHNWIGITDTGAHRTAYAQQLVVAVRDFLEWFGVTW